MLSGNLGRSMLVAAVVFVLDQLVKLWVVEFLDLKTRLFIPVFDPWLNLSMAWNEGINFGMFDFGSAGRWILIALALVVVVVLAHWVRRTSGIAAVIGTGAVIGGALGNIWDRIWYGAVADYLNMSCCGIHNPYAFNIADVAIFAGVLVLLVFVREPASGGPARGKGA